MTHLQLGILILASSKLDWGNALAAAGFVVASVAIPLSLRHLRAIKLVEGRIEKAQEKTDANVHATEVLQKQIEENVSKTETLRQETLAALGLHEVVVKDATLSEWVRKVSLDYVAINEAADPLFCKLAARDLLKSGDFMGQGSSGRITIPADEFQHAAILANLLLETTSQDDEFWASSLVHAAFWESANAYLRQQREKIAAGVEIKRVFVFDNDEAFRSKHAQRQMSRQHDAKIEVKYDIPPPYDARDLVVVRKPNDDGNLCPMYAMECKLGRGRRIEHVELWYANELQSETVTTAWRDLEEFFENAQKFVPTEVGPDDTEHPVNQILAGSSDPESADETLEQS